MAHTMITRHFDAPVEQVWDLALDLARWPKWFPGLIEVRDISGPTDQVGTTALLVMQGPDKVRTLRLQLSEIDHLQLHAHTAREVDGPMTSASTMRLAPAGGGTDLVWEQDLSLGGLFGAVADRIITGRVAARQMQEACDAFGALLKERVAQPA